MDPEVKKYFKKILNSFFMGLLWLFVIATSGLYFEFAIVNGKLQWFNWVFYLFLPFSLFFLIRYYYRTWKDDFQTSK